jgi:uncharacterized glyoxalase superfamily protein PhnB
MKPRISLVTLGVEDLERALKFYREGLGLETEGIIGTEHENGAVVFIKLSHGLALALWPRKSIAADTGLELAKAAPGNVTLAHNVRSEAEVDAVMAEAKVAGAKTVKAAQKTFYGGYAGYFSDPDGHVWEVAFNPEMLPED